MPPALSEWSGTRTELRKAFPSITRVKSPHVKLTCNARPVELSNRKIPAGSPASRQLPLRAVGPDPENADTTAITYWCITSALLWAFE